MSRPSKPKHAIRAGSTLLWIASSAVIGLLLFAYLLPQDLSRTTPIYSRLIQISFFGRVLIFHFSLLLLFIAFAAMALRRTRLLLTAGLAGLVTLAPTLFSLLPHHQMAIKPQLRVMSMNLKYTAANPEWIVDQVRKYQPDVIAIQDDTPFAEKAMSQALAVQYPHRFVQMNFGQGLAIYSTHPFVGGKPKTTFNKTRRQLRAVITAGNSSLVIYIEHPYSPRTRQRIINNRLAIVDLCRQIQSETLPVIVAGDFNFTADTPNEDALKVVGMKDCFELAGSGRGSTWPAQPRWLAWLPGFRIDHVFVSSQLSCTQFFVGQNTGSDHLPIVADIGH